MTTSPPYVNLLVIRAEEIYRAVTFYEEIGLSFEKHRHGSGPEHYACERAGFVFEIYPLSPKQQSTSWTRIGFTVADVDSLVDTLTQAGAKLVSSPQDSEWGRRAVVKDFDGHTVEFVESNDRDITTRGGNEGSKHHG